MVNKNEVSVVIDGKVLTLSGFESDEYLQKVASYINGKIAECKTSKEFKKQSLEMQALMVELNIADDYFKAKKNSDSLAVNREELDKQVYDLKHDAISAQIKVDANKQEIKALKDEISKYQKTIVELQAELEELKR